MKNTIETKLWKREFHLFVGETLPLLQKHKAESNQDAFHQSIQKVLTGIKRYISQRLKSALRKGTIPEGKYKVDDFVDELYIIAYDHIQAVKEDKDLYQWLFKKAVELMKDTLIAEDFDSFFFKNIDQYTAAEWKEMEEHFSTDGDGDLVMEEELDDSSYDKHDYLFEDVFIDHIEDGLIATLNTNLNKKIIQRHITSVVTKLPLILQSVYELEAVQKFKPEEIAYIKNLSLDDVKEYLAAAKTYIRISLEKKFFPENSEQ